MITPQQNILIKSLKDKVYITIHAIFYNPRILNTYVKNGSLTKEQAISIISILGKYNTSKCVCCKYFVGNVFSKSFILDKEFDPLLEILKKDVSKEVEKNTSNYFSTTAASTTLPYIVIEPF